VQARSSYHHGNLRKALLEAALALIGESGPKTFTLREVARRAGVTHNAPYRHFQDKDELLAAVGTQGFEELIKAMSDAARSHRKALARLKAAGLAYIAFALRRPEHFSVMFDLAGCKPGASASGAAEKCFNTLLEFVKAYQREGQLPSEDPLRSALLAWSMVHGIAKLATAECLPYKSEAEILSFARFVMDELLGKS
jgi:AcrR family transcriptional regulator